ncbi:hypothetical protein WMY93_001087 [Mugilogobius chulae]|uniref:Uncharacterized protein n=1 Tax=Mugilogobius chulae TaxID=88201 RepID=A0AAW0Q704_9GOBI
MKMFCRTDQQCICYLCSVDEHKGHDTVTAASERNEKQKQLEEKRQKILQRIKNKEKNVTSLQDEEKKIAISADNAVASTDQALADLISLLEKKMTEDKLHQEVTNLRKQHSELDSLTKVEDHLQFLRKFASIPKPNETLDSPYTCRPPSFESMVSAALTELKNKLEPPVVLQKPQKNPTAKETQAPAAAQANANQAPSDQNTLHPYSKTRPPGFVSQVFQPNSSLSVISGFSHVELCECERKLTWDPRTNNEILVLSDDNRGVKHAAYKQNLRPRTLRFTDVPQVVSKESLTGCCFWRVYSQFENMFTVAVAYRDIKRTGSSDECSFGKNEKSWAMEFRAGQRNSVLWHNGRKIEIELDYCCGTHIGVYTDVKSGILSFYRYSDWNICTRSKLPSQILWWQEFDWTTFTARLVSQSGEKLSQSVSRVSCKQKDKTMAHSGVQKNRERFYCSICLELLNNPVTTPCKHNYCLGCIKKFWDEEDQRRIYSCPQCCQTFRPRPSLAINTMLADLVEDLEIAANQEKSHFGASCVARTERQKELEKRQQKIHQQISDKERDLQVLQIELDKTFDSAEKAAMDCDRIFAELLSVIQKRHADLKLEIRSNLQKEVVRMQMLQDKLEKEVTQLKWKEAEIGKMFVYQNDSQFLEDFVAVAQSNPTIELPQIKTQPRSCFENVVTKMTKTKDKITEILFENVAAETQELSSKTEPTNRAELLQYACRITLDPNSMNSQLALSEDLRRATLMREETTYPNHPDRFLRWRQVLSKESLRNGVRSYFEVEWRKKRVTVALAYKDIARSGPMTM